MSTVPDTEAGSEYLYTHMNGDNMSNAPCVVPHAVNRTEAGSCSSSSRVKKEDIVSFLRTLEGSIESLRDRIDRSIFELPNVPSQELPEYMQRESSVFELWSSQRLEEFRELLSSLRRE